MKTPGESEKKPTQKQNQKDLSTESYKGVRDFFPAEMAVERRIFDIWRGVAEKYGYEEYGASILEPAELYRAKSGEEIVNEQTYTFTDRGEREVTLRPEMTPTVARMIAARKRELAFPVRWYSIPNLFRYENPQRGRLREHWQLNVDIFGVTSLAAEIEVISMACDITRAYGLKDSNFEVRINNRKIMEYVTRDVFSLDAEKSRAISKLIDKKDKVRAEVFEEAAHMILGDNARKFLTLLNSKNFDEFTSHLPQTKEEHAGLTEIRKVIAGLNVLGINNARFDQTLMRGFDYYTGIVFEVFDLNPKNRRSVFGGGRYDELLALFGGEKVPAVGFGAGDVVAQDLMETYGTLTNATIAPADIAILLMQIDNTDIMIAAFELAKKLRESKKDENGQSQNYRVSIEISGKKIGDQIKAADKRGIPEIIVIGEDEAKSGMYKIKNLKTGTERPCEK